MTFDSPDCDCTIPHEHVGISEKIRFNDDTGHKRLYCQAALSLDKDVRPQKCQGCNVHMRTKGLETTDGNEYCAYCCQDSLVIFFASKIEHNTCAMMKLFKTTPSQETIDNYGLTLCDKCGYMHVFKKSYYNVFDENLLIFFTPDGSYSYVDWDSTDLTEISDIMKQNKEVGDLVTINWWDFLQDHKKKVHRDNLNIAQSRLIRAFIPGIPYGGDDLLIAKRQCMRNKRSEIQKVLDTKDISAFVEWLNS